VTTADRTIYRADDKFDVIQLEKKEVTYSYFAIYVCVHGSGFNQYDVEKDNLQDALPYSRTARLRADVLRWPPISVELPNSVRAPKI